MVSRALLQHEGDYLAITLHALHLVERTFIMRQPQPLHAINNGLHCFRGGTLQIGVFNTQNESTAETARKGPGKQRRTCAAKVEVAGWARGKAGANGSSRSSRSHDK